MKTLIMMAVAMCATATTASAESTFHMESMELQADSMPAALTYSHRTVLAAPQETATMPDVATTAMPEALRKSVKRELKPYKFMDDMTFVGVPLFVAGIIAKSEKKSFRQDYDNTSSRSRLVKYNFHNELDNYTQFAPMLLTTGLNLAGVEGRSSFGRYLVSGAMSYAIMAAIVNPIKYTAKEMRPDGSTRNSWPSGHTATAFVSATILHKEYGLTRSPWYSVAGYGIATATGVMRVLNNRHWVSDVLSGAGIGILSTEIAYGLSDLIFKGKGLKRNDLPDTKNMIENPSFFNISMGIGLGSKNMNFDGESFAADDNINLKFQASTVVGAEAAYFFNKYVGVGGRLRVKSSPIKGWDAIQRQSVGELDELVEFMKSDEDFKDMVATSDITIESDHITEFAGDIGLYFNLPLSPRWALGSKLLVGRSITQDLDLNAHTTGRIMEFYDRNGNKISDISAVDPDTDVDLRAGDEYDTEWDYFTLSGNNTMKYGTGLSLTYAYKSSFSWRIFVDYDFTRKTYTMEYNPDGVWKNACPALFNYMENLLAESGESMSFSQSIKKNMNNFVIGGSFCISF